MPLDAVCASLPPDVPLDALPPCSVLAPFYRADASRSRAHGGVRLGLSIAHDIALRHRGSLSLRNADAGGLVASLELTR